MKLFHTSYVCFGSKTKCITACSSNLINSFRIFSTNNLISEDLKTTKGPNLEEEQFRVIDLIKKRAPRRIRGFQYDVYFKQPREKSQPVTQDWGSVWPGIRSFHPATVPLPVRMGFPNKGSPNPDKWGNAELMKIPNFLHLTPPVIKRQCEAIKKFCTAWPKELESREAQKAHFPVTVTTNTYLHSSPSLRDHRSRIVSYAVPLDSLDLDKHALDKILRLVGDRYDPKTNVLTLIADRCPLKSQNLEYCQYVLTVLYNESKKTESWEHEKQDSDFENFNFDLSSSKENVKRIEQKSGTKISEDVLKRYSEAVTRIHNENENEETLSHYKNAVTKILNLSP